MTAETSDARDRRRLGRRVAVGGTVAGLALVLGTAVGTAGNGGDERDGRDTSDTPGAPTDDDVIVVADDDLSDGRTGDPDVPPAPAREVADGGLLGSSDSLTGPVAEIVDNGRGGVDPAVGPRRPPRQAVDAATSDVAIGSFDTDTGEAPTEQPRLGRSGANDFGGGADSGGAPVDQDVPGAPTMSEPGADEPSNDADG